jgi:hypothetical protein
MLLAMFIFFIVVFLTVMFWCSREFSPDGSGILPVVPQKLEKRSRSIVDYRLPEKKNSLDCARLLVCM